jgi:hypothetical protein
MESSVVHGPGRWLGGAGDAARCHQRKCVSIGAVETKSIYYCECCRSSFFDGASVFKCGNTACVKGICINCAEDGLCDKCHYQVWLAVVDLQEQTIDDNADIDYDSDSSISSVCPIDVDVAPPIWFGEDTVDIYDACGYDSDDVCELALRNCQSNGTLRSEGERLSKQFESRGIVRTSLSVNSHGIVKVRLGTRTPHTGAPMSKSKYQYKKPHYGSSEPLHVKVQLAYCDPKYFNEGPVKLGMELFRARTYVSPAGWKTYTAVTPRRAIER